MIVSAEDNERVFETSPVRYVHPDRVIEWLPDLPASVAKDLASNARLWAKLSPIIEAHYDLGACPEMHDDIDHAIAQLPEVRLLRLVEAAGAVWHGKTFAMVIDKATIRSVMKLIDEDAFRLAVAQSALAPKPDSPITVESLNREAIDREGRLCFSAWLNALPTFVSKRVALKFSPQVVFETPSGQHEVHGPAIVRICGEACLVR
jgi:hypothetical protein